LLLNSKLFTRLAVAAKDEPGLLAADRHYNLYQDGVKIVVWTGNETQSG